MNISIERLTKAYQPNLLALDGIDLNITGGMFGLLGPNGAGKSTLMQIMATLLAPTEGTIRFGDYRLGKDDHEIRRALGYLPQYFGLYQKLTGEEFLTYIATLKGYTAAADRRKRVTEMLEKVNLSDKAKRKIKTYSGGMKQRIGIAQALLGDPRVIIVDEPTAGLDPEERVRFRNLLEDLSLERTVLLSTHIVADIESSCGAMAVMRQGKLVFKGAPDELLAMVKGKVWTGAVTERELPHVSLNGKVVSQRKTRNGFELRILAAGQPFAEAVPAIPDLEDGYMALAGVESHE